MCRANASLEGCVLEITAPAPKVFDLGGPNVTVDLTGTNTVDVLRDNIAGRQLAIKISYAGPGGGFCSGDAFILSATAGPVYNVPLPVCYFDTSCSTVSCFKFPLKIELGTVNGTSQDFQQVNSDQCPDIASCTNGPAFTTIAGVPNVPITTVVSGYNVVTATPTRMYVICKYFFL